MRFTFAIILLFGTADAAHATIMIPVGDRNLLPNTAGQVIQILATGDNSVQGFALNAQIADGGPGAGGSIIGPGITANIITGTILASNNTGQSDLNPGGVFGHQIAIVQTSTNSGTVLANGLLATLLIDTTGFFASTPGDIGSGHWSLRLRDTANGPSNFGDPAIDAVTIIVDGSIQIVPEPSTIALATFGVVGLAAWGRRRKRLARSGH